MATRFLRVVRAVFWLSLAVWIGMVVFFSLVVAPGAFQALPRESASTLLATLFPRYYALGALAGVLATAAGALLRGHVRAPTAWVAVMVLLNLMLAATLYAGTVVEPRARTLRPALHAEHVEPATQAEFDHLHRLAVQLNGAVLVLGVATICLAANLSSPPR